MGMFRPVSAWETLQGDQGLPNPEDRLAMVASVAEGWVTAADERGRMDARAGVSPH